MQFGAENDKSQSNYEFDIREDEEQRAKLQDIIDLLVAAGYFRARIKTIPPFDMVVGGMVWCISHCNMSLDIDLFYSDISTIGQKIWLTERIVEVLPQLACPHAIEPHQIQGLDFIHIFPVIQWLVKQAIEAKNQFGDDSRNYAVYQFNKRFSLSQDMENWMKNSKIGCNFRILKSFCLPKRVSRRIYEYRCLNLIEDLQCTLMEYEWPGTSSNRDFTKNSGAEKFIENEERLSGNLTANVEQLKSEHLSAKALAELISIEDLKKTLDSKFFQSTEERIHSKINFANSLANIESELEKLKLEENQLEELLNVADCNYRKYEKELREKEENLSKYRSEVENADIKLIEKLRQLISEHDDLKKRETDFKINCKMEMKKLEEKIENFCAGSVAENGADIHNLKSKWQGAQKRLTILRQELANINWQIALEQRYIDSVPLQLEISQYQRRIIELYNQIASKHQEMTRYFALHNTLVDIQAYIQREIALLNSIEEVQHLTSRDSYKESFFENLQEILRGVGASLDKISIKRNELQKERDNLSDDYQYMLEKERLYHKTVDNFKNECQFNEELRRNLQDLGHKFSH